MRVCVIRRPKKKNQSDGEKSYGVIFPHDLLEVIDRASPFQMLFSYGSYVKSVLLRQQKKTAADATSEKNNSLTLKLLFGHLFIA